MQTNYKPGNRDQRPIDLAIQTLERLQLHLPGASLADTKKSGNTFNLTTGDFGKYITKTDDTIVKGVSGTTVAGLEANHRLVVESVHFSEGVTLGANAQVVFTACTFDKPIVVASGGKVLVSNSVFGPKANIQNAGIAANAGATNTIRQGPIHTNTTVIFEVV